MLRTPTSSGIGQMRRSSSVVPMRSVGTSGQRPDACSRSAAVRAGVIAAGQAQSALSRPTGSPVAWGRMVQLPGQASRASTALRAATKV